MATWLREYAATLVVAFCVLMVALLNIASGENFSGSILGSLNSEDKSAKELFRNKIDIENSKKKNLATVALFNSDSSIVSEEALAGEFSADDYSFYEPAPDINSQIVLATSGPQVNVYSRKSLGTRTYEVKNGDTVSSIAAANGVSINTLLWANNLSETSMIKPGDKLSVLPVTGTRHKTQKNDSVEAIAKKYGVDSQKIIAFNELTADGKLKEGQDIIVPDGSISAPASSTQLASAGAYGTAYRSSSVSSVSSGKLDGRAGGGHRFPYGYCTWYVAQRKYVPWGGNAGAWLSNARASGKATGRTPQAGAIIVTGESRWGHVGIVEKVSGNTVTISEMNYAGFGKKSTRTINANSRTVKGFIY